MLCRGRLLPWAAVGVLLSTAPTHAQPAAAGAPTDATSCVDVQIGTDRYYSCLNRQWARMVPPTRFSSSADAPYSATSPAPQVGTFNQAATAERLGSNFGKSVVPQRPPPAVFSSPLIPAR
jgi:hypothetical protein